MANANYRLLSYCGRCGKEAPKKKLALSRGRCVEVYDDERRCECGEEYHRTYGAEKRDEPD